jgi:hypothetical protein
MRLIRLALAVIAVAAAVRAVRHSRLAARVRRALGGVDERAARQSYATSLARDTVAEIVDSEPAGATIGSVADEPEALVEAERELLTVPGEPGDGHRRRDQTAGAAAQEIAAAQVRSRRNGSDAT